MLRLAPVRRGLRGARSRAPRSHSTAAPLRRVRPRASAGSTTAPSVSYAFTASAHLAAPTLLHVPASPALPSAEAVVAAAIAAAAAAAGPRPLATAPRRARESVWRRARRGLTVLGRLVTLGLLSAPLIPLGALHWLDQAMFEEQLWDYTHWATETAGPFFIKMAQWAASRRDLFPPKFCERMASLQDRVRARPWRSAELTLRRDLGDDWERTLRIDSGSKPLGAGCIAQVYRAICLSGKAAGKEVAVKIVHPGVKEVIDADIAIISSLAGLAERLPHLKWMALKRAVEAFADALSDQLDMRLEADNLRRFGEQFSSSKLAVRFPRPISSTEHVLVEEYIDALPIAAYAQSVGVKENIQLARLGIDIFLKMLFDNNFIHGDLHAGNMLVEKYVDAKGNSQHRIVILDCGIVVALDDPSHKNILGVMSGFMLRDGRSAAQHMIESALADGASCAETVRNTEAFMDGIQGICTRSIDDRFFENVGDYCNEILRLAAASRVKLESHFLSVALAVKVVEGIAHSLDPDLDIAPRAVPHVMRAQAKIAFSRGEVTAQHRE